MCTLNQYNWNKQRFAMSKQYNSVDTEYTVNTRSNKHLLCFVLQSHHNSDVSRTAAAVGVSDMGMGHRCASVTEDTNQIWTDNLA